MYKVSSRSVSANMVSGEWYFLSPPCQAFNTFIDDVFAFIIVMPTSHRIAVFRDDLVFLVYLYQRWWVM